MKCLCCRGVFDDQSLLKEHYVTCHNVCENNNFFKELFTKGSAFAPRKCFWCQHFCFNRRDENNHNFPLHYQLRGRLPVEDKSMKKTFVDEILQKFYYL